MAPHGAVATEEVAVKAEKNSAGEAGLSSTAGFYLTRSTRQRLRAHRHQLQLCVICGHGTQQSSVLMYKLSLLKSKGFPVEFCSSADGECLTGPADGDQRLPTESKRYTQVIR